MRVLFARPGTPYSPYTGKPNKSQSVEEIVDKIKSKTISLKEYVDQQILSFEERDKVGK